MDDLLHKINARSALFVEPVAGGATLVGYAVSGFSEDEYSVVRYTDAGQVDHGFSIPNFTFKRIAKIVPWFVPTSIAVQGDGSVLLAGFDLTGAFDSGAVYRAGCAGRQLWENTKVLWW